MINDHLKDLIKNLPQKPGIYKFLDRSDKIIYIGKAKNLKKRVASYFNRSIKDEKTNTLVSIVVPTYNHSIYLKRALESIITYDLFIFLRYLIISYCCGYPNSSTEFNLFFLEYELITSLGCLNKIQFSQLFTHSMLLKSKI